jgi:hypothetical protein
MGNMGRRPKQMKTYKEGANQTNTLEHHTLKASPAGASLCTAGVVTRKLFVRGLLASPKLCNDPESHCF